MEMQIPAAVLEARQQPTIQPHAVGVEYNFSAQLTAHFDKSMHAMWSRWSPEPRPCFNPALLADIRAYYDFLAQTEGQLECYGEQHPVEYVILASGIPGVFNLGGDLDLFKQLIDRQDRDGLVRYGRACIDVLYRNYVAHDLPVTTISLVEGECLGGGFEAALSSDIVIAERQARFGFPEILFNLFPGMGAYSFLDRRVGRKLTEELLSTGRIYSADDMLERGVIDYVVEPGQGETEVAALIRRLSRTRNGMAGIAAARRRINGITYQELLDVVHLWVDAALRLTSRDLKLMQRLVSRQNDIAVPARLH